MRAAFLFNQSPNFNNLKIFKNVIGRSMFFVRVLKNIWKFKGVIYFIYTHIKFYGVVDIFKNFYDYMLCKGNLWMVEFVYSCLLVFT